MLPGMSVNSCIRPVRLTSNQWCHVESTTTRPTPTLWPSYAPTAPNSRALTNPLKSDALWSACTRAQAIISGDFGDPA